MNIMGEDVDGIDERLRLAYTDGYRHGLKEGIRRYAWWKDGIQYVGTCGRTLKQALKDIECENP